jgi:hypothetical protein
LASEDILTPGQYVDFHDLVKRYSISYSETWLDRLINDARAFNYASIRRKLGTTERQPDGSARNVEHQVQIRIAAGGIAYLDRHEQNAIATKIIRSPRRVHRAVQKAFDNRPRGRKKFSSQLWTGRYDGSGIKLGQVEEISDLLTRLEHEVDALSLSNFDKAQLQSKLRAMRCLVEAPKPNWRQFIGLMIDFLSHPALAASLVIIDLGAKVVALAMQ